MRRIGIVGAGPAGSAAGFHLAARGFSVTLIDRAHFPRDKVCGDWIPHAALRELESLGVDAAALPGATLIRGTALASPAGLETSAATRSSTSSTSSSTRAGRTLPRRTPWACGRTGAYHVRR